MKQYKHAAKRKIKPYIINRCIVLAGAIAVIAAVIVACTAVGTDGTETPTGTPTGHAQGVEMLPTVQTTTPAENTPETSHSASGEATETPEPIPFFYITDEERTLIEEVVAAESRGEPHDGQVAVAECILNACLKDDIRPAEAIERYKYTKARATPTYSVQLAVAEVFDEGKLITDEPILYFYNPAYGTSEFHESQTFVLEIENHRFFKEAKA